MAGRPRVEDRSAAIVDGADETLWISLQSLADPVRLRIVRLLGERERCVCDLTEILGLSQGSVSHHVGMLRRAGLVLDRRDARWIYYRLDPEATLRFRESLARLLDATRVDPTPADCCELDNDGSSQNTSRC